MSLYTVMSVNRTVFIDLNSGFKLKINSRLGARVAYKSHRSGLSPGIGLGQANFYPAGSGAG